MRGGGEGTGGAPHFFLSGLISVVPQTFAQIGHPINRAAVASRQRAERDYHPTGVKALACGVLTSCIQLGVEVVSGLHQVHSGTLAWSVRRLREKWNTSCTSRVRSLLSVRRQQH